MSETLGGSSAWVCGGENDSLEGERRAEFKKKKKKAESSTANSLRQKANGPLSSELHTSAEIFIKKRAKYTTNIYFGPGAFEVFFLNSILRLDDCSDRKDQSERRMDEVPGHKYSWPVSRP